MRITNARNLAGEPIELFVENGRFVESSSAPGTLDLAGNIVLPGFVDAHCHIIPMGLDLQKLHLGECETREEILDAVRDWSSARPEGWLMAVHYDQTRFSDNQHLTRWDLDRVVPDRPVILRHSNGHASVANSAALAAASTTDDVSDPEGGTYMRNEAGDLTGVLLERAHELVTAAAPDPTLDEMVDAVLRASEKMLALGVTCASDMMTGRWNLEQELLAYHLASQKPGCVRLRLYAQWGRLLGPRRLDPKKVQELCDDMNPDMCRLAGAKIFADGAVSSATAAIYGEYETGGSGQLIYSSDRLDEMMRIADDADWTVAVHSIGDRATDAVMDAMERCGRPSRHRIEHAMILSDQQIDRLAGLGMHVTMQPEFLVRFGHAYAKQLGPERTSRIKRVKSVLQAGIPVSFSSDRPIVPGDPWDGIGSAVNRPEGFDPTENIDFATAVRLYTADSAEANGDSNSMGTFAPGAFADFQSVLEPEKGCLATLYLGGKPVRPFSRN